MAKKGYFIPFSQADKQKIKDEFLTKPIKPLARELGVSPARIMRFLDRHNLELPKEIREKRRKASLFKKGQESYNKGLKRSEFMSEEGIKRVIENQFKKGHTPSNISKDGAIVERTYSKSGKTYKHIRIKKGVWRLYQRQVWEDVYGEIPENHVIAFIDGDTLNTDIENLELISMTENMLRNSINDYPEEIIPSMVLINQLENRLKDLQNE